MLLIDVTIFQVHRHNDNEPENKILNTLLLILLRNKQNTLCYKLQEMQKSIRLKTKQYL